MNSKILVVDDEKKHGRDNKIQPGKGRLSGMRSI